MPLRGAGDQGTPGVAALQRAKSEPPRLNPV